MSSRPHSLVTSDVLAVLLALASSPMPALAQEPPVAPGSIVRWPGTDVDACELEGRRWAPLGGTCFFPVDLLHEPGELELRRTRQGRAESRRIRVAEYPYPVQRIQLPDDRMVHLSPEDLARADAEQERVAALWPREGERRFELPLAAPLDPMPSGGRFGSRRIINGEPRSPHSGSDYAAPRGTPVRAVAGGTVLLAEEHFFGGNSVFVHHGDGLVSMYLHLDRIEVTAGDEVARSQRLGVVGSTGRATGPHLHFGLRWHGARVAPELLLAPAGRIRALSP
jgi:murein DD-endopeptidase MepM/ murein hydrolase activator NlpD